MDNIESRIKEVIEFVVNKLKKQGIIDNPTWTRDIMTALHKLADEEFGYRVYTSKANDYDQTANECLYDMLWYESLDGHINDLNRIHLALESEWNRSFDEIRYDFYKLVQVRAEHRVMIFRSSNVIDTMKKLINIIEASKISEINDKYLLVGRDDKNNFTFQSVIKGTSTKRLSDKFAGNLGLTEEQYNQMQNELRQSREDWH